MTPSDLPPDVLAHLHAITAKRPRTVIEHILEHGYVTTEELRDLYGYNHPPRAARDVREQGIPLVTFRVTGSDGRSIGAYKFGDLSEIDPQKQGGRQAIPRAVKDELLSQVGPRCVICLEPYDAAVLQVDHCIPYEIAGDIAFANHHLNDFMLICGSCNRAKSWTCEHCPNWHNQTVELCQTCYWAHPTSYQHIATEPTRRVDVVWQGDETAIFDALKQQAALNDETLQAYIKAVLARHLTNNS